MATTHYSILSLHDALPISKIYPACAIELYASSRFMFVCTSAPRLPANMVSTASTQKAQNQYCVAAGNLGALDRKSTRLNSSHEWNSYAVFCFKKKKKSRLL